MLSRINLARMSSWLRRSIASAELETMELALPKDCGLLPCEARVTRSDMCLV